MTSGRVTVGRIAVAVGLAVGLAVVALYPTVSVAGLEIPTGTAAGVISGILLLPSIIQHYQNKERRKALQWGLFGLGIPLSLTAVPVVREVGLLAVLASAVLAWEADRRLLDAAS